MCMGRGGMLLILWVFFFHMQTLAWRCSAQWRSSCRLPFIMELKEGTFLLLSKALHHVCDGFSTASWPPPSQEQECMAVSLLNILCLQVSQLSTRIGIATSQSSCWSSCYLCSNSKSLDGKVTVFPKLCLS